MPVTTISSRFCQRERFSFVDRLGGTSFAPTASTNKSPHVKTIVPLSLRNPCCQKIISSGLRRIAGLRWPGVVVFDRRAGQPLHDEACQDKAKETQQPPLPILAPDKIKSHQRNVHPKHHAADEPKRWPLGRNAPDNRPPKAAEEKCADQ